MIPTISFIIFFMLFLLLGILLYFKYETLYRHQYIVYTIVAILLFISIIIRYFIPYINGNELSYKHLPLEFCRINVFLTLIYITFKKPKFLQPIMFFLGTLAFTSILSPNGNLFLFKFEDMTYTYIVDHVILALLPLWLVLIDNYRPKRLHSIIVLVILSIVAWIVLPYVKEYNINLFSLLSAKRTVGIVFDVSMDYLLPVLTFVVFVFFNIYIFFIDILINRKGLT